MRKLIVFLLIAGAGYYLYTHQELWRKPNAPTNASPNAPLAWNVITRNGNRPFDVEIDLIDGSRWRVESKTQGSSKILVAVCDGSTAVSNIPRAPAAAFDPRPVVNQLLDLAAKTSAVSQKMSPQVTEQRDGH